MIMYTFRIILIVIMDFETKTTYNYYVKPTMFIMHTKFWPHNAGFIKLNYCFY